MKPLSIGIIGGAGPLAGAYLLERLLSLSISKYGCYQDADFPEIFLTSFPFSEMLAPTINREKLQQELADCLDRLRRNGAGILVIACNTLHAFLNRNEDLTDLIFLPSTVEEAIPEGEIPLVLCASTSVRFSVHREFFPCAYPDVSAQFRIDRLIGRIMKGEGKKALIRELKEIISERIEKVIVLGCTELSLL